MTAIGQTKSTSTKEEYIESIDALFLKLELAYHYQFYKVFGTDEKLKEGKKLWAVTLKNETPEVILEAVESVISSQSYLPTLTDLMKACKEINRMDGFPTAEEAYMKLENHISRGLNLNGLILLFILLVKKLVGII